jgi:3-hydroxybutyryl-CoA dehydrogenase
MSGRRERFNPVGVVGLGLLGRGIATCLLAQGFQVVAYEQIRERAKASPQYVEEALSNLVKRAILPRSGVKNWQQRLSLAQSLAQLGDCVFVIEAVNEDLDLKQRIYEELEAVVSPRTIIASNTSGLPITALQSGRKHPQRFVGMHWGEPAEVLRYLEIIPGKRTSPKTLRLTKELGTMCGKDPTVLRVDIRGFISNRLMYAMIREACHLVEAGVADIETVDQSFRNDIGWWSTLAGPFRWMDLTGIPAYATVMEGLLPNLCSTKSVPKTMRNMVSRGALGISNRRGFYKYSRSSAKAWEKTWLDFTYDIRKLVEKYKKRGA